MTLSRDSIDAWVAAYERVWRTVGTEGLGSLFAEDATYRMSPYEQPAVGLAEIAELWERERESADEEFEMSHEVVAAEGETAVIKVAVHYGGSGRLQYRDLWIVRFDTDGLCREFEEWPFWPGQQIVAEGGDR
jgi:ketosteroid isomerase-like protein